MEAPCRELVFAAAGLKVLAETSFRRNPEILHMSVLFSPFQLRGLALPNRIMVAPMCQYSAVNGEANDWHFTHINSLALSGAAIFCIEATAVEATGRITPGCLGLWNDATEAALKPIMASVRKHSKTAVTMQLAHAGRKASSHTPWEGGQLIPIGEGGWQAEGPSEVPHKEGEAPPKAFDTAGLARVRDAFVSAARRAERLGIDGLELHCAHGYLLHQFLSPISNRRTDQYGGSLQNRMRYPLEVFEAIRAAFPHAKPVGIKVSVTDWVEGGWDLAQTIEFARALKTRGVDWIDASSGGVSPKQKIPLGPGYQVPVRASPETINRRQHHRGRPDHAGKAGRGDRRLRKSRYGRARPRHAVRPALGLARGGRTRRPRRSAAGLLARPAARIEGSVRSDVVRDEVRPGYHPRIPFRPA